MKYLIVLGLALSALWSCNSPSRPLPILGNRTVSPAVDTIFPIMPDSSFVDQDSQQLTNATFAGKIYVADFFFTHCPTICPKVKAQAMRIIKSTRTIPTCCSSPTPST